MSSADPLIINHGIVGQNLKKKLFTVRYNLYDTITTSVSLTCVYNLYGMTQIDMHNKNTAR